MTFWQRIQNLPDNRKKIILWTVTGLATVGLFFLVIHNFLNRLEALGQHDLSQDFKIPNFPKLGGGDSQSAPNESLNEDLKSIDKLLEGATEAEKGSPLPEAGFLPTLTPTPSS